MRRRGMEAVASKGSRRMPVFMRKAKQQDEEETPPPPMPSKGEREEEDAPEGLRCPKCGMELADTEENRAYADARADEMASEDEDEDED